MDDCNIALGQVTRQSTCACGITVRWTLWLVLHSIPKLKWINVELMNTYNRNLEWTFKAIIQGLHIAWPISWKLGWLMSLMFKDVKCFENWAG